MTSVEVFDLLESGVELCKLIRTTQSCDFFFPHTIFVFINLSESIGALIIPDITIVSYNLIKKSIEFNKTLISFLLLIKLFLFEPVEQ